jgi:CheY-like chemotaxis protein
MPSTQSEPRLILIAERDENVRELQRHFLSKAGFMVEFADDGESALARARIALVSLVVTEIFIPKIDGLALCRRLRADPLTKDVPVIVFSILASAGRATEAGASAFLRKPFVESVFLTAVHELIGTKPILMKEHQWSSQ